MYFAVQKPPLASLLVNPPFGGTVIGGAKQRRIVAIHEENVTIHAGQFYCGILFTECLLYFFTFASVRFPWHVNIAHDG